MIQTTQQAAMAGRGPDATRLDAFVDAAFAFAVSLLVVAGETLPTTLPELKAALARAPAFAVSFALIALFWLAHRDFGRLAARRDGVTTALSLMIVFVTLIYVVPLRVLSETALGWISGGTLPGRETVSALTELRDIYILYGVGFAVLSGLNALLFGRLLGRGQALGLDEAGRASAREWWFSTWAMTAAGLLSISLAGLGPLGAFPALPGLAYFLIPLAIGAYGLFARPRTPKMSPADEPGDSGPGQPA